ncbi:hypothetical protein [Noviherbaspirillum malthae]|uniref:hypothetical protein n=1 Tax=Noviherbaspirillum malthae TaxID=1260987 RepID=UPI00188FA8FF|nr:hypothetical protein [Noviherbaspirillum malthae]
MTIADNIWGTFGANRFTLNELWSVVEGRRTWPGFPTPEWKEHMLKVLKECPLVEPAPGPRGGAGWRLKPDEATRRTSAEKRRDDMMERSLAFIKTMPFKYGRIQIDPYGKRGAEIIWSFSAPTEFSEYLARGFRERATVAAVLKSPAKFQAAIAEHERVIEHNLKRVLANLEQRRREIERLIEEGGDDGY